MSGSEPVFVCPTDRASVRPKEKGWRGRARVRQPGFTLCVTAEKCGKCRESQIGTGEGRVSRGCNVDQLNRAAENLGWAPLFLSRALLAAITMLQASAHVGLFNFAVPLDARPISAGIDHGLLARDRSGKSFSGKSNDAFSPLSALLHQVPFRWRLRRS